MKHARPDYNRIQDPGLHEPSLVREGATPIAEDEPVFLLRASDITAASTVLFWLTRNKDNMCDVDLNALKDHYMLMVNWDKRKRADVNSNFDKEPLKDTLEKIVATPSSRWSQNNEHDPHGSIYECERAVLSKGHLTDDELANAVYMEPNIENLTAAKERIRWLSRALEKELNKQVL